MGILTQGRRLLDALFTRTQRQLLGLFFGQPERSFYLNEIVRRAGVGTGSVQRELARLSKAGLIVSRRIGNQRHYQADTRNPLFEDLCALARKTVGVIDCARLALEKLPSRPDLALLGAGEMEREPWAVRLLLVCDTPDDADIALAVEELARVIGRPVRAWPMDRRRFLDLVERDDVRLRSLLDGPKVILAGSVEPSRWR